MPDWQFVSGSSGAVSAALWATIASIAISALMLLYTIELRIQRRWRERRRARVTARWRTVIAAAVAGTDEPLPPLPRGERAEFLRLWNVTRNMIEGAAADRLIELARRLDLIGFVRDDARLGAFGARLAAIQALGHLRDAESFATVAAMVDDENMLVSITAAEALAEIDPVRAVDVLIPKIAQRREWPRTHVFRLLQKAGSSVVSEPLFRYIRSAGDDDAAYMLQYVEIAEFDVRDAIVEELLRTREDANLLAAALKAASGYGAVPRLFALAEHPAWYVRMQAAKLMGRAGRAEHIAMLEHLLRDPEWWVRYRAARALTAVAALSRETLASVRTRATDPFAQDILDQVMAEAGAR
jgi:HEAT repeat protein